MYNKQSVYQMMSLNKQSADQLRGQAAGIRRDKKFYTLKNNTLKITQKIRNIFFQNARRCTLKTENSLWKTNVIDLMSEKIKEKKKE